MRVLVACEFSGVVRDAFIERGHDAISCDILPTERPKNPHMMMPLQSVINATEWDLIVAFPPCTHLASVGAQAWPAKQADGRQQQAIGFVRSIYDHKCPRVAIENPVGILSTAWRKPDQIVNPFQFGQPFKKKTCFWLKGLPALVPTNVVEPQYSWTSSSVRGGGRKKAKLPIYKAWNSAEDRSRTFQGIADAMADQWSAE